MAVCSEIHTKHINTVCGQNESLSNSGSQSVKSAHKNKRRLQGHDAVQSAFYTAKESGKPLAHDGTQHSGTCRLPWHTNRSISYNQ